MSNLQQLPTELQLLLDGLCEERLTPDQISRLERLVLTSDEARWQYLTYMDLHGTLYWDAAGAGSPEPLSSHEMPAYVAPVEITPAARSASKKLSRHRMPLVIGAMATCLAIMLVAVWQRPTPFIRPVAVVPESASKQIAAAASTDRVRSTIPRKHGPPISIDQPGVEPGEGTSGEPLLAQESGIEQDLKPDISTNEPPSYPPVSSETVIARIGEELQTRWTALGLQPSARADDSEWLRRVYLDIMGRVPTVHEAQAFLADKRERKRATLVDVLLNDSGYARNFTTKWANLLIGRSSNPQVNRDAFEKFLRVSFSGNRPWNQIVSDLISAEGNNAENGATNFLIAHLNNDATPATAVCSKLFLGRQVHCNQCHNNPFDQTKQLAFWELNSFFQQTTSVYRQRRDPNTGRLLSGFTELVTRDAEGPTYFETQTGLMQVAYPRYNGKDVDSTPETNRRVELARLMTAGEQPQLAAAFINRMWEHFFGIGFTRSVDDMGPHDPASHPELLTSLSDQFIRSGYDIKQLVRWICLSEPYQLSSQFSEANRNDDPTLGELPAFSRMYVKSMTAEQTYDSFLTATKAHQVGAVDWTQAERNRQQWLRQFVVAFHTDENDEKMVFEGSIGNALSLMNGPLISKALDTSAGSFLGEIVRQKSPDTEKIRLLCMATLSRAPSPSEFTSMKKMLRDALVPRDGRLRVNEAYQDLFWALLNSNEFASIH
jgi:Protein of unknown function (DUF1549)/Protein of unknown function (DUF1553)